MPGSGISGFLQTDLAEIAVQLTARESMCRGEGVCSGHAFKAAMAQPRRSPIANAAAFRLACNSIWLQPHARSYLMVSMSHMVSCKPIHF